MEILAAHKEKFGTDFAQNKKVLDSVAIIRSKELKNELAGYITSYIKREIEGQKEKEILSMQTAQLGKTREELQEEEILT